MAVTVYKLFGCKRGVIWVPATASDVATAQTSGATGLALGAGQGLDFDGASALLPHKILLGSEVEYVTGVPTPDNLSVVRAKDGSVGAAHATGTASVLHLVPVLIPKVNVFDVNTNIVTIPFTGDGDIENVYESNGITGTLGTSKFTMDLLKWVAGVVPQTTGLYSDETNRTYPELGSYPEVQIDLDYKAINEATKQRTRLRITIWQADLQKPIAIGNAGNNTAQGTTLQWSAVATVLDLFGRQLQGVTTTPVHYSYSELVAA
jgi:hypothetical protein